MLHTTEILLRDSKIELADTISKINRLQPGESYTDRLAKSFHLGMVGGSGRNTYRLNQRRERELDKTIETAKLLTPLYSRRDTLEALIARIESGEYEKQQESKADRKERNILAAIAYWNALKAGDILDIGNSNGNPTITKKNAKSVETGKGCKWTVKEIIGAEAAARLQQVAA